MFVRRLLLLTLLLLVATGGFLQAGEKEFSMKPTTAEGVWEAIHASQSDAVLVNVWATWCQPCREEMPDLLKLQNTYQDRGFTLLLVSADFLKNRKQAEEYLIGLGVDFATLLKDQNDMAFIEGLHSDWSGALPFSMLVDRDGNIIRIWQGKATYSELENAVLPLLQLNNKPKQTRDS